MNMSRRGFLKGTTALVSTTALVPVLPALKVATYAFNKIPTLGFAIGSIIGRNLFF